VKTHLKDPARERAVGSALAAAAPCSSGGGLGGVMEDAARGAAESGGTVIGIPPVTRHRDANDG